MITPILNRVLPSFLLQTTSFEKHIQCAEPSLNDDCKSETCYAVIEKDDLDELYKKCKRNAVTIHSACQTAGNIAMCEMIKEAAAKQNGNIISTVHDEEDLVMVAPSCKRRLPEQSSDRENYVMNGVYFIREKIRVSDWTDVNCFWELTQDVQSYNHGNMTKALRETYLAQKVFNWCLSDPVAFHRHFRREKRTLLHGYTNHGNCNYLNRDPDHGIKVCGLIAGGNMAYFTGVAQHMITTVDNRLFWNVVYPANLTDKTTMSRYLQRCIAILKHI